MASDGDYVDPAQTIKETGRTLKVVCVGSEHEGNKLAAALEVLADEVIDMSQDLEKYEDPAKTKQIYGPKPANTEEEMPQPTDSLATAVELLRGLADSLGAEIKLTIEIHPTA